MSDDAISDSHGARIPASCFNLDYLLTMPMVTRRPRRDRSPMDESDDSFLARDSTDSELSSASDGDEEAQIGATRQTRTMHSMVSRTRLA